MSELTELLKKSERKAAELEKLVLKYTTLFKKFRKSLNESLSTIERKKLDTEIIQLEVDIQTVYDKYNSIIKEFNDKILNCDFIDLGDINYLNETLIEIERHFFNVRNSFDKLKKLYKDYDFDKIIDISILDRRKKDLNVALMKINTTLLVGSGMVLWNLYDCDSAIYQQQLSQDYFNPLKM